MGYRIYKKCGIAFKWMFTLLFLIISNTSVSAQIGSYFTAFKLDVHDNVVIITWTTAKGFTCEDLAIEFGSDSMDTEVIYVHAGICGDRDKEETYSFVFNKPILNQPNYFRLDLGTYGTSYFKQIRVVGGLSNGVLVAPSPSNSTSKVYWQNPTKEQVKITVYTSDGTFVSNTYTTENFVQISELNLTIKGFYYAVLSVNGRNIPFRILYLD